MSTSGNDKSDVESAMADMEAEFDAAQGDNIPGLGNDDLPDKESQDNESIPEADGIGDSESENGDTPSPPSDDGEGVSDDNSDEVGEVKKPTRNVPGPIDEAIFAVNLLTLGAITGAAKGVAYAAGKASSVSADRIRMKQRADLVKKANTIRQKNDVLLDLISDRNKAFGQQWEKAKAESKKPENIKKYGSEAAALKYAVDQNLSSLSAEDLEKYKLKSGKNLGQIDAAARDLTNTVVSAQGLTAAASAHPEYAARIEEAVKHTLEPGGAFDKMRDMSHLTAEEDSLWKKRMDEICDKMKEAMQKILDWIQDLLAKIIPGMAPA